MLVKSMGTRSYARSPIQIYAYGEENNNNLDYNVYIGNYTSISDNLKIVLYNGWHDYTSGTNFPFSGISSKSSGNVIIGNDIWIGRDVTIMSGVTIGDGAVIAANSHVVRDVEPYSVVGGNPAKFIKYRFDKELIDKFLELKWWDYPEDVVNSIIPYLRQKPTLDIINKILIEKDYIMNRKEHIEHLYRLILDREADPGGLNHYVNSKCSLADIQAQMSRSEEFLNKFKINQFPHEELNNDLPIFIINLARRVDRKQKLINNLNLMKIKNYTFIEAVDGSTLQNNTSSEYYNKEKAIEIKREMVPNEIACALSHLKIFRKMVDENIPYAIVMEDDCIPNINLHNFIKHFDSTKVNTELVLLGYWSSNQWHNGKVKLRNVPIVCKEQQSVTYLEKPNQYVGDIGLCKPHYPSMTLDYVSGTTCGLYSLEMAKKILDMNYPVYTESDNVWNFLPLDNVHLAYPLCAFTEFNDSDLEDTRLLVNSTTIGMFSKSVAERVDHPDFGT